MASSIRYVQREALPAGTEQGQLMRLLSSVFSDQTPEQWAAELTYHQTRTPLQLWLAYADEELVGCKIGYERKPGHFYSWLGCVAPAWRGRGIAGELLQRQHTDCRAQGYHHVRTHTYNRWRAMLLLNLRHGFDIIGTVQGPHGLTIVLEKEL